ncbi:MAG: hypothetical protein JO097_03440 [Acidobacteriaceae bacterium]|nr:hypothetical protein [Acidobacteriaceae bacterium]
MIRLARAGGFHDFELLEELGHVFPKDVAQMKFAWKRDAIWILDVAGL